MTTAQTDPSIPRNPLRLWPGVVAALLLVLVRVGLPAVVPNTGMIAVLGGLVGALAIVVWWLFFSRAPWSERLGGLVLIIVALFATSRAVHESIRGGFMGMMLYIFAPPFLGLAFVAGAVAGRRLSSGPRLAVMGATLLLPCGAWTLLRTDGITGAASSQLQWRWTETSEERLLAQGDDEPVARRPAPEAADTPREPLAVQPGGATAATPSATAEAKAPERPVAHAGDEPAALASAPSEAADLPSAPEAAKASVDWPGFRGPERDGIIRGVRIETDWSASPPVELWRRPIGPGWSSFAVHGDLLYTQEQRGDDEIVACYNVTTGEPVWKHRDPVRFWESNGGAGPRATPTLSHVRIYTFGATGIVNALDAVEGTLLWSRNAASDSDTPVPGWGFTSSPLVVDDVVIVAAAGTLVGYDFATGELRWVGPDHGGSYSSPHLVTIDGVAQILLLSDAGATSVAPATGTVLWEHAWPGGAIVQPALTADGDVVINALGGTGGLGTRRLSVSQEQGGWNVEERWTSIGLKPYFNDFVLHEGHAFGFDGSILACIDLETGKRKWKGGRYGSGQLVLLPEQDLLLVMSEEGELALVSATPDQFTEIARSPAIEGKTWNHPALVGDVLLARNGEEMAAFRLSLAGR